MSPNGKIKILLILSFVPIIGFFIFIIITSPYSHLFTKKEMKEQLKTILVGQLIIALIFYLSFYSF